jgi:nucleoside-diphosphate-sugar epimerase
LITGNQGFIGPVLTRMAQARGHHVTGLDIGYFQDCGEDWSPDRQIVRDMRDLQDADVAGVDAVIHLAGLSNDPMGALSPHLTRAINLDGTLDLAARAKAQGVGRFVFASSCSLYGSAGGSAALDETAAMAPVSAYAVSKARAEEGLLALADDGFSPVMMRNATAYGVGPRPRFDLVVNNLAGWAHAEGVLKVMSDGTPWRPLVHIEDIALAALCAAEAPRQAVHAQAFNIGRSDANYQVRDIAQAVGEAFPNARLEITGETGGDPRSYRVSFDKALSSLPGFEPRWTLQAGVEEVARFITDGGLDDDDFRSRRFIRLAQLQHAMAAGKLDAELRPAAPLLRQA